jgi:hypothetical protein
LEKLSKYMKSNNLSESDVLDRLKIQELDPAKDLYTTLVEASRDLTKAVKLKNLDLIDDTYFKSLFQLLQAGDKINKSLKLAQLEAYGKSEEDEDNDDSSFLDRVKTKK